MTIHEQFKAELRAFLNDPELVEKVKQAVFREDLNSAKPADYTDYAKAALQTIMKEAGL